MATTRGVLRPRQGSPGILAAAASCQAHFEMLARPAGCCLICGSAGLAAGACSRSHGWAWGSGCNLYNVVKPLSWGQGPRGRAARARAAEAALAAARAVAAAERAAARALPTQQPAPTRFAAASSGYPRRLLGRTAALPAPAAAALCALGLSVRSAADRVLLPCLGGPLTLAMTRIPKLCSCAGFRRGCNDKGLQLQRTWEVCTMQGPSDELPKHTCRNTKQFVGRRAAGARAPVESRGRSAGAGGGMGGVGRMDSCCTRAPPSLLQLNGACGKEAGGGAWGGGKAVQGRHAASKCQCRWRLSSVWSRLVKG